MKSKIINIRAVVERTGLGRRTVYQAITDGRFPRPLQLTARRTGWLESEIDAWLDEKIAERDRALAR